MDNEFDYECDEAPALPSPVDIIARMAELDAMLAACLDEGYGEEDIPF